MHYTEYLIEYLNALASDQETILETNVIESTYINLSIREKPHLI